MKLIGHVSTLRTAKVFLTLALLYIFPASAVSEQCFIENDATPQAGGKSLSDGSTQFTLALFKNVLPSNNGPEDNVFISPFSVWSALMLTYFGSRGQTKKEMENGLGISSTNQKRVSTQYQDLKDKLLHNATEKSNYTFNTANKVYFDQEFKLRECIIENFNSETEKLNFKTSPEPSRLTINGWVESVTNDKIKDLLPKGYIDDETVMVLVNAAYFKGTWSSQFRDMDTNEQDFFTSPDKKIKVDMMFQQEFFPLLKSSPLGCSAIELPYSGDEVQMVIILPDQGTKVEDLIPKLTPESLQTIYDTLKPATVEVSLPKLKIEQSMELNEKIQALGIRELFDDKNADLSGFTGKKEPYVKFIRHKTFIDVKEGGTEAAAASAVVVTAFKSGPMLPIEPEKFTVNRPFVLILRNKPTNTVLFIGLIRNPKK